MYSPTACGHAGGLMQLPISPEHVLLVEGGGPAAIRDML